MILVHAIGAYLLAGSVCGLAAVAAHQGWIEWLEIANRDDFDLADEESGSQTVAWCLFVYCMAVWPLLLMERVD